MFKEILKFGKTMFKDILNFGMALCLGYLGFILYNILIQARDLSQIRWGWEYLLLFFLSGILGIVLRYKYYR